MHSLLMKKVIMYSSQTTHVFSSPLHCTIPKSSSFFLDAPVVRLHCLSGHGAKKKRLHFDIQQGRNAISKTHTPEDLYAKQEYCVPEIVKDDDKEEEVVKIKEHVDIIKSMLSSMEDGEISISAYDTAWVALIQDIHNNGAPQFPSSLLWIAENQLPDGSWGDSRVFLAFDRIINTLACVVALKSWNVHPDKCERGISFLKENISMLEKDDSEHMLVGFEFGFPVLLDMARRLGIDVPDDSPFLQAIYVQRDLKLKRIPKDILHNVPTTLLHSLEAIPDLDWTKLLKLQCQDGSLLFSPSSTAMAFINTKDENCLRYLNYVVQRFNGGAPTVYPYDLFEHNWAVDRLQRLGISRFFQPEIRECMSYVYRYWTKDGIFCTRNSRVHDVDDTAMGFRLLRLHGYEVHPDAFRQFKKGCEFICYEGQSHPTVTVMYNLYRASQLMFPEEKILDEAKQFTEKFLGEKRSANKLLDKWIITKDLPGEVGFALDVPWYASMPRVEARFFIQHYGGEDDVWLDKALYRMPYVNNNVYLELAKLDYNYCQALHGTEWGRIQKWYEECKPRDFGISRECLLRAYFMAAASIFEPERSMERLAWAKTAILLEIIVSYFNEVGNSTEQRIAFTTEFSIRASPMGGYINGRKLDKIGTTQELIQMLLATIDQFSQDAFAAYDHDITRHLHNSWKMWLLKWQEEGDRWLGEAELVIQTINLMADHKIAEKLFMGHTNYEQLFSLTNKVCYSLGHHELQNNRELEHDMQRLVQLVLTNSSDGIDSDIKKTFLAVAKRFYYTAFVDPETVNVHIAKVLFERVD
ncbi:(-)-kolavenyl diphosphate synthase TPS14, chloroplastic-like isoform X1 [Tripterygium wilfordii]|uniref:(-)-kolavenyl diphosphate synthase TPS14, chloroplastic-like isoform X1 n=2 Tax=Tripterygium wilfordii TaxID=458696 RepID=UPI0018F7EEA8|nr:(-)-kolavenyl diphosphate synthase TPS14, chloroplastic-like isoform X1 [Tripterygium wilfordii]